MARWSGWIDFRHGGSVRKSALLMIERISALNFVRSIACLLMVFSVGVASPVRAIGVGVVQAKLKSVHLEFGVPFLTFDQPVGNPDGCASNAVVVLAPDLQNQQFYLSLAMTAMASGKSVSVWVDGCAWAPWSPTVPKVYAMQMAT